MNDSPALPQRVCAMPLGCGNPLVRVVGSHSNSPARDLVACLSWLSLNSIFDIPFRPHGEMYPGIWDGPLSGIISLLGWGGELAS